MSPRNITTTWDPVKWLDNIVTINTTNVVKRAFEVLYPKKGDEEYDESKKYLLAKLQKVQAMCQRYSRSKTKIIQGGCKHLKGPWKHIWVGVWYGYHRAPRSLKYQEEGLKVGTQRYDGYKSRGWRTFLAI
jgi:hypothetical protein